jgi:predicted MPP superfamily phosphohydrolase
MFKFIFLSLGPLCWLLALFSIVLPLKASRAVKTFLSSFLFVGAFKFWWFLFFSEKMFQPDFPVWLICVLSIIYDFSLFLGLLSILKLIIEGCILAAKKIIKVFSVKCEDVKDSSRRDFISYSILGLAGVTAIKGVYDAMRLPDVKRTTIELNNLPPFFDGYKIVHLSDIHVSPSARAPRSEGIVKIVNSLDADLIVITGDFIDGRLEDRREDFRPFEKLRAKDGVLGCTGNHEYYSHYEEWRGEFIRCGINMLENRVVNLRRKKGKEEQVLAIGGINDPVSGFSDVSIAFENAEKNAFRILLAHRPINLKHHKANGVKLQLSGHTHGGAILGMDHFVAKANEGHVRGLYQEDGIALYVNAGTGQWAGFPTRLGVMPEVSLLILKSTK